jgi:hypothetical protein
MLFRHRAEFSSPLISHASQSCPVQSWSSLHDCPSADKTPPRFPPEAFPNAVKVTADQVEDGGAPGSVHHQTHADQRVQE